MVTEKTNLSVVIPTMNRPESLRRTVCTMMNGNILPAEIIVVDQSKDPLVREENQRILKQCPPSVSARYFFQEHPSLTAARNNGFSLVSCDIVICSDDDIDVKPDTLQNVAQLMSNPEIALLAGFTDNSPRSKSISGYFFWKKNYFRRKEGYMTLAMLGRYPDCVNQEIPTEWAMGYFFVVRKSLAQKWNCQWDEKLTGYAYAEDLDFSYHYCKCARKENLRCILSPKVTVTHRVAQEWRTPSKLATRFFVENREYLRKKHHMPPLSWFAVRWCNWGELFFRILHHSRPGDLWDAMLHKKTTIK